MAPTCSANIFTIGVVASAMRKDIRALRPILIQTAVENNITKIS
jgi:hypothetical protein